MVKLKNKAKLFVDYVMCVIIMRQYFLLYHSYIFQRLSRTCHICVAFSMKMYNYWFLAWKFKLLFHNDFWGSLFIPVWNGSKSATASNRMKRPPDHKDGDPRGKSEGFTTNLGENVLFKSASFFFKNRQGHHILCCCTKIKIIYVKCPSIAAALKRKKTCWVVRAALSIP